MRLSFNGLGANLLIYVSKAAGIPDDDAKKQRRIDWEGTYYETVAKTEIARPPYIGLNYSTMVFSDHDRQSCQIPFLLLHAQVVWFSQ